MRWRSLWFAAALLVSLTSCAYIPYRVHENRDAVEEALGFLTVGITTREEVLLTLGQPDWVKNGERLFLYWWFEAYGLETVVESRSGRPSGLRIEFDDDGKVLAFALEKAGFFSHRLSSDFYSEPGVELAYYNRLLLERMFPCQTPR
jgi:outer membrane protein assembly factor BamE (lipoprotein component of BamABCDE complex)